MAYDDDNIDNSTTVLFDEPSAAELHEAPQDNLVQDAAPAEDEADAEEDTETLYFQGAFYIQSYTMPAPDGGTLVFDRNGTAVPAGDADQIVSDAAALGVTLTRKAN
jgi:hypothetical protein